LDIFKKITTSDRDLLKSYLDREHFYACDYSAGNLVLWSAAYETSYAVAEDTLFLRFRRNGVTYFTFPMGTRDIKAAFNWLRRYCAETGETLRMDLVEPEMFERIEAAFPGKYTVEYSRDNADYLYTAEALANFSGKRYHSKKNHVNEFMRTYPDWSYEPITDASTDECIAMGRAWCEENGCCTDHAKSVEMCVLIRALENRAALGLRGGFLRAQGRIVALALGERCGDMLIEHFEKAFSDVPGAYPMICQQFVRHEAGDARYVNREEDMGIEGLRKSKESYRPAFLAEKGRLIEKAGGPV
jgi:hypothetical protein